MKSSNRKSGLSQLLGVVFFCCRQKTISTQMINNSILAGSFLDFVKLGILGHQIDASGPNIGVCLHGPESERSIEKIESMRGQSSAKG